MKKFLLLAVLGPFLVSMYGLIPPVQGTFRCEDPSIQFPFSGETVSTKLLLTSVLLPIALLVFLTEVVHVPRNQSQRDVLAKAGKATGKVFWRYWVIATGNVLINLTLKTLASTPRPHFIHTCNPDWERINCTDNGGNVKFDISLCHEDVDVKKVNDAMKSFPSGHAQLSWFASVFVIVYLTHRVGPASSLGRSSMLIVVATLQLICALLALVTSISRITDHRHHTIDVVVGSVLGIVMGWVAARGLAWTEIVVEDQ